MTTIIMPKYEGLTIFNKACVFYGKYTKDNDYLFSLPLFSLLNHNDVNFCVGILKNLFYVLNINTNKFKFYRDFIVLQNKIDKLKMFMEFLFLEFNRKTITNNVDFCKWVEKLEKPLYMLDLIRIYDNFSNVTHGATVLIYDRNNDRFLRIGTNDEIYCLFFKHNTILQYVKTYNPSSLDENEDVVYDDDDDADLFGMGVEVETEHEPNLGTDLTRIFNKYLASAQILEFIENNQDATPSTSQAQPQADIPEPYENVALDDF